MRSIVAIVIVLLLLEVAGPAAAHHADEPGLFLRARSSCQIIGIDQDQVTFHARIKAIEDREDVGQMGVEWRVYHRSEATGDEWAYSWRRSFGSFGTSYDGQVERFPYRTYRTTPKQTTDEAWRLDAKVKFMDPEGFETIVFHRYRGVARSQRQRPRHGAICHDTSTD